MQDRLKTLGRKPLRDLVLPASHDAGMYKGGFSSGGRTQELSIYEQLRYGIRYFDLRPWWIRVPASHWVIAHGEIIGPSVQTVLNDVRKFAEEKREELVILKISHFRNIDNGSYEVLRRQIENTIGEWLVRSTPGDTRLADVTLNEYVAGRKGPAILVVIEEGWAVNHRTPGLWVYRDWDATPVEGDLRVFRQVCGNGKPQRDEGRSAHEIRELRRHDGQRSGETVRSFPAVVDAHSEETSALDGLAARASGKPPPRRIPLRPSTDRGSERKGQDHQPALRGLCRVRPRHRRGSLPER